MSEVTKQPMDFEQQAMALSEEMAGEHFQASWFVVMSKPRQEVRACAELREQGYDVYLPQIEKMQR